MRQLLEDDGNTDVSKLVGIVIGVAGGVIIITGILWYLYRRYGGLESGLSGIPPERKMLVFTELGKLPDSAQRTPSRPNSARPPSAPRPPGNAALAAAVAAAQAASLQAQAAAPSPRPTGRPTSASRAPGPLLPTLSTGLEADPLPTTPGSIASPRGHGRSIFNTMDHPRVSNTGAAGTSTALGEDSRPSSAVSGRPTGQLRAGTTTQVGDGERPGSAGAPRPGSAGSASASAADASSGRAGSLLPPALVPTGSVTSAWKAEPSGPGGLEAERSLNSVAGGTRSPLEAFEDTPGGPGTSGGRPSAGSGLGAGPGPGPAAVRPEAPSGVGYVPTFGAAASGRPPLPGRTMQAGGGAGVAAPAGYGGAAAAGSGAAAALGPGGTPRPSRSRPGSGNGPGGGEAASGGGGGGGGSASPSGAPSWQRPHGMRTPRQSQGIGRLSSTGVADDAVSVISGGSSQFHSFSHVGDDALSGNTAALAAGATASAATCQQGWSTLAPHLPTLAAGGTAAAAAAEALPGAGLAGGTSSLASQQRSRLGTGPHSTATPSAASSQASLNSQAPGPQGPQGPQGGPQGQGFRGGWVAQGGGGGNSDGADGLAQAPPGSAPARTSASFPTQAAGALRQAMEAAATPFASAAAPAVLTDGGLRSGHTNGSADTWSATGETAPGGSPPPPPPGGTAPLSLRGSISLRGQDGVPGAPGTVSISSAAAGRGPSGGGGTAAAGVAVGTPQSSPTQTAWAAAVSLSSKLFGSRGRSNSQQPGSPPLSP